MKTEFKVGDRVIAYGRKWVSVEGFEAIKGVVTSIGAFGYLSVDYNDDIWICDPKQCRRLKPKAKPREIWVNEYGRGLLERNYVYQTKEDAERIIVGSKDMVRCVCFREVKE